MKNYKNGILLIFFLLLPILAITGVMFSNAFSLKIIAKELLFNSAILVFIVLIIHFINKKVLKNILGLLLLIPFYSILFIKIFTLINFFNFIDNAVLYTVFETNSSEISGFLDSYSKWYHVLIATLYVFCFVLLIFKVNTNFKVKHTYYIKLLWLIYIVFFFIFIV